MAGPFAGGHVVHPRHRAPSSSSAAERRSAWRTIVAPVPAFLGLAGPVQALVLRTCHPTTHQRLDAGVPHE
ncbi:hypothetical protein EDD38_4514 [Kitasatospora cineracea]|uniref:Uncharacterized protein n=1 Tax=Kitasatospora cineracea TaxID=88074 RepID=A0A3N4S6G3_9ACTN|nr:hypothetical protein EDD38_4514 [Kitasatospora cineracea]